MGTEQLVRRHFDSSFRDQCVRAVLIQSGPIQVFSVLCCANLPILMVILSVLSESSQCCNK